MPAGFRRSRALWDETKRLDQTASSRLYATICAILYELQPIRLSQVNWRKMLRTARKIIIALIQLLRGIISNLPGVLRALAKFLWQRKLGCLGVIAYYFAVRWIHEFLEAGPMVVMFTVLIGIFTIGLSDNDESNREGLSAYSVFNRGFERLLGSVDAEALLAQHVGMGPGAALPVGVDDNAAPRRARRPRRQERAAAPRVEAQDNNDNDDDNNDNDNEEDDQADEQPRNNRARKSGKKARRRNLEQRRDRQQQRDAAMALGMQGAAETEQEMIEMQRLIENQIAEQANNEN
mmetsp:Transcript_18741/g.46407  ORF Transcript_18741/g.46407 Transcript_18741/m.46407 type:complete len:292 (+) Transcript_18741:191-1066(+)